jgi:hypothetical protein
VEEEGQRKMLPSKVESLFDEIIVTKPSIIKVDSGVTIRIDKDKNITIEGQNSLSFRCEGDVDFDAEHINLHARKGMTMNVDGEVYMGSSKHIIQQAPRIDFNPYDGMVSGYFGNIKGKVLEFFNAIRFNRPNITCEEIDDKS